MIFKKIGFYKYFKLSGTPLSILHLLAVKIGFRFGYFNKLKKKNDLLKKKLSKSSKLLESCRYQPRGDFKSPRGFISNTTSLNRQFRNAQQFFRQRLQIQAHKRP